MKVLIAVSCFLAVASAGIVGLGHSAYSYPHLAYAGLQHLPVIGANGVPVDEPAVQVARAEHAAAHVEAAARNGDIAVVGSPVVSAHVAGPVSYAAGHLVWAGPQHLPVIGANGVPVDEPAVQARRVEHAAAHVEAAVRNGDAVISHVAAPVAYAAHVAAPVVAHANGAIVPAETPEVAAARAAHYAAHAEVNARNGAWTVPLVHYRRRRSAVLSYASPLAYAAPIAHITSPVYAGPQHLPVIGANGVPVDEPAVQIARANHAAAQVEAHVRNGDAALVSSHVAAPIAVAHSAPLVAAHVSSPVYTGPQHLPVIGANGVPVDEPAVQIARANHAVAQVEAQVRNGDAALVASHVAAPIAVAHSAPLVAAHVASPVYTGPQHLPVIGANGVPVDEPAVQVARAVHSAHHVEASVRNGDAALVSAPVAYAAHHISAPVVSHVSHVSHLSHVAGAVVPAETPEVAAARVAHAAAHVEAQVRNGDLHIAAPVVQAW